MFLNAKISQDDIKWFLKQTKEACEELQDALVEDKKRRLPIIKEAAEKGEDVKGKSFTTPQTKKEFKKDFTKFQDTVMELLSGLEERDIKQFMD